MSESPPTIAPEDALAFVEVAQWARMTDRLVRSCPPPRPGSRLGQLDRLSPHESVSGRAAHYASASLEHLTLWADYFAPLKYHPEQRTRIELRPAMALARAALETAAQGLWLLDGDTVRECLRRHVRLIRWDWEEYRRSRPSEEHKRAIGRADRELLRFVSGEFTKDEVARPSGHRWMIRTVCEHGEIPYDPDTAERVWASMCGAAHGMYWTRADLTVAETLAHAGEEVPSFRVPDTAAMAEALKLADSFVKRLGILYLQSSGLEELEVAELMHSAFVWLSENVTLREDAPEDFAERAKADESWRAPFV